LEENSPEILKNAQAFNNQEKGGNYSSTRGSVNAFQNTEVHSQLASSGLYQ
jgi:hypothetical protein